DPARLRSAFADQHGPARRHFGFQDQASRFNRQPSRRDRAACGKRSERKATQKRVLYVAGFASWVSTRGHFLNDSRTKLQRLGEPEDLRRTVDSHGKRPWAQPRMRCPKYGRG